MASVIWHICSSFASFKVPVFVLVEFINLPITNDAVFISFSGLDNVRTTFSYIWTNVLKLSLKSHLKNNSTKIMCSSTFWRQESHFMDWQQEIVCLKLPSEVKKRRLAWAEKPMANSPDWRGRCLEKLANLSGIGNKLRHMSCLSGLMRFWPESRGRFRVRSFWICLRLDPGDDEWCSLEKRQVGAKGPQEDWESFCSCAVIWWN